jgi:phage-related minor tail protein
MNAIQRRRRPWAAVVAASLILGIGSVGAGAMQAGQQEQLPSKAKQARLDKDRERDRQHQREQAHRPPVQQPRQQPVQQTRQQPLARRAPVQPALAPPPARHPLNREQQERLRIDRERAERLRTQEYRPAQQREDQLKREKRSAQRRYEQDYYRRLVQHRNYWIAHRYDPYRDPFYYTPPIYRYRFDGRYYQTNRYGAHLMQLAVNFGYQEGLRAGIADREDGWAYDYRSNDAYQDASYGYYGYYLDQLQYRYYFREGFRRGYDDGYYRRYRYGRIADDGTYVVIAAILSAILGLQPL